MNRSVWFPGDLAERVEAEAARLDRSFNWVVVRALESALGGSAGAPDASAAARVQVPPSASSRASRHAPSAPGNLPRSAMVRQERLNKAKAGK